MQSDPAVIVRDLRKSYGSLEAVKGVEFQVNTGEVFGLLGPNGAGKTTTVEIPEGLRPRLGGDVTVLGFDPRRAKRALRTEVVRAVREGGVLLRVNASPPKG